MAAGGGAVGEGVVEEEVDVGFDETEEFETLLGAGARSDSTDEALCVLFYICGMQSSSMEESFRTLQWTVHVFVWLLWEERKGKDLELMIASGRMADARMLAVQCPSGADIARAVAARVEDCAAAPSDSRAALGAKYLLEAVRSKKVQMGHGSIILKVFDRPAEEARAIAELLRQRGRLFAAASSAMVQSKQPDPVYVALVPRLRETFDMGSFDPHAESNEMTAAGTLVEVFPFKVRGARTKSYNVAQGRREAASLWRGSVRYFAETHDGRIPLIRILFISDKDALDLDVVVRGVRVAGVEVLGKICKDWVAGVVGTTVHLKYTSFVLFAWDPEAFEDAKAIVLSFFGNHEPPLVRRKCAKAPTVVDLDDKVASRADLPSLRARSHRSRTGCDAGDVLTDEAEPLLPQDVVASNPHTMPCVVS